jgi:hypothetical protein
MRALKQRSTCILMRHGVAGAWFVAVLAMTTWVGACADEVDTGLCLSEPRVVAPFEQWEPLEPDLDPFWDDYDGDAAVCPPESHGPEAGLDGSWWEIETVMCGYLTLGQPTAVSLCAGETLVVRLWHFNLLDTGADFRVVIVVGEGEPLIDETVGVPSSSELVEFRVVLEQSFRAGVPLRFHLSNHGSNSWGLMDIVTE